MGIGKCYKSSFSHTWKSLHTCQQAFSPSSRESGQLASIPRPPQTYPIQALDLNTCTHALAHEHLYLPSPEQPHPKGQG